MYLSFIVFRKIFGYFFIIIVVVRFSKNEKKIFQLQVLRTERKQQHSFHETEIELSSAN